ncbi:MAG: serine hydrolase [Chitinophagaceae bacterium]|nr:serine hydrolase [Chitinophagaceae bacterium]
MKKIFFLLTLPFALHAQKNYSAQLDEYMQSVVDINNYYGNVLIAKGGNIIYQKSFGYKDYQAKFPLDNNSIFEVGAVTEQFTAAAILLLAEQNRLTLTDHITKYFPELPYKTITIEHLLTNTSGLPEFYEEVMKDKWKENRLATNADMIYYLSRENVPLHFQPGQKYEDTGTGFSILASIIEKISGLSYKDFLQQNIFNPLQLKHTGVLLGAHVHKTPNPEYAQPIAYDEIAKKYLPADSLSQEFSNLFLNILSITDSVAGTTNISSTTGDLLLWDLALKNNTLLTATTQKKMFAPHVLMDTASKIFYGYGTMVGKNELGNYVVSQELGNFSLGFGTSLIRYTNDDVVIIVMSNKTKEGLSQRIGGALSYILYNKEVVPLYVHKEVSIDTSLLDRYVGKYSMPLLIEIIKIDGKLYRRRAGAPDTELKPETSTKFFYVSDNADEQLEFVTDRAGKVVKAYYIGNGLKKEIKKL